MLPHEQTLLSGVKLPKGSRILNLGNKPPAQYVQPFQEAGFEVIQLDLNGLDGAVKLDLCQPIDPQQIGGQFDLVTNFGTTEHVEDQARCWENVNSFVALNGAFVSTTPLPGEYETHGIWYPLPRWYYTFGLLNGYEVKFLDVIGMPGRMLVCYVAQKTQNVQTFTMPEPDLMWRNKRGLMGAYDNVPVNKIVRLKDGTVSVSRKR